MEEKSPQIPIIDEGLISSFTLEYLPARPYECTEILTIPMLRTYFNADRDTIIETLDPMPLYLETLKEQGYIWHSDPDLHQPVLYVKRNEGDLLLPLDE